VEGPGPSRTVGQREGVVASRPDAGDARAGSPGGLLDRCGFLTAAFAQESRGIANRHGEPSLEDVENSECYLVAAIVQGIGSDERKTSTGVVFEDVELCFDHREIERSTSEVKREQVHDVVLPDSTVLLHLFFGFDEVLKQRVERVAILDAAIDVEESRGACLVE
jgi:hypothetical protein